MRSISATVRDIDTPFAIAVDDEAIRQRVGQRLRLFKGEDPLQPDLGTDWFGKIFGKRNRSDALREIDRSVRSVRGVFNVIRIEEVARTNDDIRQRRFKVEVEYITINNTTLRALVSV